MAGRAMVKAALVAGTLLLGLANAAVADETRVRDLTGFAEALRTAGWQVEAQADGSLILTPTREGEATAGGPSDTEPEEDSPQPERRGATDWSVLRDLGWGVETDAQGATLLYPPGAGGDQDSSPSAGSTAAAQDGAPTPAAAPTAQPELARQELARDLDALLAARGWRTRHAPDGSLLLFPLSRGSGGRSGPTPAAGTVPNAVRDGTLTLPIDTWSEAKALSLSWLASVEDSTLAVGKIREIHRVYLVSIIDADPPHALRHQIAIGVEDGRVVVLN